MQSARSQGEFISRSTAGFSHNAAALRSIAESIRALLLPSPALYCLCNQERLGEHGGQLAAIDAALEDLRKRAFAAATRLLSLDPPQKSNAADGAPAASFGGAP